MKNKELFFPNRRDFLKIPGLVAGTLTADLWGNVPFSMARDIYPSQKITYVIPHKPGGGHDVYARSISPYLTKHLRLVANLSRGGDIIIRNEPAAAGRKGRSLILHARPDGNTIGIMDTSTITDSIVGEADIEVFGNFLLDGVDCYATSCLFVQGVAQQCLKRVAVDLLTGQRSVGGDANQSPFRQRRGCRPPNTAERERASISSKGLSSVNRSSASSCQPSYSDA